MDKKKRLARLPPRPVPAAFDIKTNPFGFDFKVDALPADKAEHMRRMWMKKSNLVKQMVRVSSAPDFSGIEDRMIRGNSYHSVIMDEITMFTQKPFTAEYLADRTDFTLDEWRWAVAFRLKMGVNEKFYEEKTPEQRRAIEAEWEVRAKQNNLRGKTAARVVAHRVKMVMEDQARPNETVRSARLRAKNDLSQRFSDQMDAYAYAAMIGAKK